MDEESGTQAGSKLGYRGCDKSQRRVTSGERRKTREKRVPVGVCGGLGGGQSREVQPAGLICSAGEWGSFFPTPGPPPPPSRECCPNPMGGRFYSHPTPPPS